jgi:hypothetical protein
VAANFAFERARPKKNLYDEDEEDWDEFINEETYDAEEYLDDIPTPEPNQSLKDAKEDFDWDAAERRMNVVGQNGNDGEHYKEAPPEKKATKIIQKTPSKVRLAFDDGSTEYVDKDDTRIDYL